MSTYDQWANERGVPAARLIAFEEWLLAQMRSRLVWPTDPAAAQRQAGQCRAFVLDAVAELGAHGYLFRPKELAELLTGKLDQIARLQKAGNVLELYPYFRATWRTWVRCSSEELRDRALLCGSHVRQITERAMRGPCAPPPPSLCELAAQLRRERRSAKAESGKLKAETLQSSFDLLP
jgi:hypothetical protein